MGQEMQRILFKATLSLLLAALAGCLMWYAVFTNRIAAGDWDFIKEHPSAGIFPEVRYWWGNYYYYVKLDPDAAIKSYKEAIAAQPLLMDAWLDLAKAEANSGNEGEAHRILGIVAPRLWNASYWKWKEILLAFDFRDYAYFEAAFNFILSRLPLRVHDACDLALRLWGNWSAVIPYVNAENRPAFIRELMAARAADEVVSLWEILKKESQALDQKLLLDICEFLLNNRRIKEARDVWSVRLGREHSGIYDGGFESQPTNAGFGWRFVKHPEIDLIRRAQNQAQSGPDRENQEKSSLCIRFSGAANIPFNHVSQVVPVDPGKTYQLAFARKSRDITTDQGVFLHVSGYRCNMPQVKSRPITGTTPWEVEKLEIFAPDGCEALLVQVCRSASLKFNNKISGDYWLGSVELQNSP